jgi:tetratricopeptide (TPR) repeat protein
MPGGRDKKRAVRGSAGRSIVARVHLLKIRLKSGFALSFPHGLLRGLCGALALLAVTGTASAAGRVAAAEAARDPNASTVIAEIALERGDCRAASETYAAAAQRGDVGVARRSSEVALACEHLPAAWDSVKRWRSLAPSDRDAAAIYATVALKLYRVPEARSALATVLKAKPGDGDTRGRAGARRDQDDEPAKGPDKSGTDESGKEAPEAGPKQLPGAKSGAKASDPDAQLAELAALFLQEADASATFAALSGALNTGDASPAALSMLAELALEAYDVKRAEQFASLALKRDPTSFEATRILARAYVMKGDSANAIATARQAMKLDPEKGAFELAETLASLDRIEEARFELERLRAGDADKGDVDRRLALLAFQAGDFIEAQRRFTELATSEQATDGALLYLADIAERDGDSETALAGYRRLINSSSLGMTARTRAAAILLEKKERGEALAMLDDYVAEHPDRVFEMTVTKASLLADSGELDTGLALLAAALDSHPAHPSLQYDRAVMLERAGRIKESVSALEHLLGERAEDPTLLNALGYTLADHGMELPRAEGLIRKSLAIMPDNPAVLDSMGWVRFKRGDSKGAIQHLKRAYSLARDPEIAAHWAEALWKSGAQQEARAVLATALARNPDSEKLKKTLTRLAPPEKT